MNRYRNLKANPKYRRSNGERQLSYYVSTAEPSSKRWSSARTTQFVSLFTETLGSKFAFRMARPRPTRDYNRDKGDESDGRENYRP